MRLKSTYLLTLAMLLLSFTVSIETVKINDTFRLLTPQTEFEAGHDIVLKFSAMNSSKPNLYLSNSYGSIIIKPVRSRSLLSYQLPKSFSNKAGVVNWKLLNSTLAGKLNIHPKQDVASMETYLGPPSIEAGETDYTMLVVIPTDIYDNPLKDSTQVSIKHQFSANERQDSIYMKNNISYKNIYSKTKTGRILISSESLNKNSKEYDVNILPAIPTDFTITYNRNHEYTDGNQITNFSTSIIKDKYDNIVSDGTYVDFLITNASNYQLKTSGSTVNGIATAKMIHPDHQDNWTVKAFIEGLSESNSISITYNQSVEDFEVAFSERNRIVSIGPLKSFMGQMIPDGLEVKLHIYQNHIKIKTLYKDSFSGYANFNMNPDNFPDNIYTFKIEAAGIKKTYQNIKLW